jgi:iron complex transport system substrate-binding protein
MRLAAALLVLVCATAAAGGCSPASERSSAPPGPAAAIPSRIVVLSCGAVDVLTALGELDRVVAVEEDCPAPGTEGKVKIRNDDHPGQVHIVNVESVLALHPDAVIAKDELRPALEGRGVRVVWSPDSVNMDNLAGFVADVGALVGAKDRAAALLGTMRAKEDSIRARAAGLPRVRVYFETTGLGRTVGRGHVMDQMIALAGGTNIAGEDPKANVVLNAEAILAADPDVIVLGAFADKPEEVLARPGWSRLAAVRNGRVHQVPLERRYVTLGTPRCVDGCEEMLLPWLHPEAALGGKSAGGGK